MKMKISGYETVEMLYESNFTLIYRARRIEDGSRFILKVLKPQAATAERLTRFRREFSITSRLDLPGAIKASELKHYQKSLMFKMEDISGESLDLLKEQFPMPPERFLQIAIALADALGGIHRNHIIHKDINPSNIIWNSETGLVKLIDFGIADELPQYNVTLQPPSTLEGTLAYISPEQTGRMNRSVDYRTDFYSLGITFYEMLTGTLPFNAADALEMVHCHIARMAAAPHNLQPDIPVMISGIIMKLMSKMAEDRYQSAWGLKVDLENCRCQMSGKGAILPFELGHDDISDQFRIPQKLYGREKEIGQLLESFERASSGRLELFIVAGSAGVGKTSLVHEVHKPITEKNGYYIEGKFDQLQHNVPYSGWIMAFKEFLNYLLMESEAQLAEWRQNILNALRSSGRVLTNVMPNLELIIGSQPDVPELGGVEAQNRFNYVFLEFIKAITGSGHPLVVFLDDLQWIDAASLNLLQTIVGNSDTSGVMLIGAYRDSEVDDLHPLTECLETVRKKEAGSTLLMLENLSENTVNELIADTLHCGQARTIQLARLIHTRTGGNAFFTLQILRTMAERQAISFDAGKRSWQWDASMLGSMEIAGGIVSMMLGKIQKMAQETQHILSLAACLGFRFSLSDLSAIALESEDVIQEKLQPALREGLIIPSNRDNQFVHDRVQQASYLLIPDADRKKVHLRIGKLLLQHFSEADTEEQLFTTVDHLNMGAELLETADEKLRLARLNLRAGLKANTSAAYSAAAGYFDAGAAVLEEHSWATHYNLALELHTLAAEAASLSGSFDSSEKAFKAITRMARTPADMAGAYESRIQSFMSQGKLQEALDVSLEIITQLGLNVPSHPTLSDVMSGLEEAQASYSGIAIEELAEQGEITDANITAIIRVASKAALASYTGRPALFLLLTFRQVMLLIRHGNTVESPYVYGLYAGALFGLARDIESGHRFIKLVQTLFERTHDARYQARTINVINALAHFVQPLRDTLPNLAIGYQSGLETGDLEYGAINAFFYCSHAYLAGVELGRLETEMAAYHKAMRRINSESAVRWLAPYWQAVLNLRERLGDPCSLRGKAFDQEKMLPSLEATENEAALAAVHVNLLMLRYLFGDYEGALASSGMAARYKDGMQSTAPVPVMVFYDSLTRLQLHSQACMEEQACLLDRVAENQRFLEHLAGYAPANYLHRFLLVEAERSRVAGDDMSAVGHYNRAIAMAREHGYIQEAALAQELVSRFWLSKGNDSFARLFMIEAYRGYSDWQAPAKTRALEEHYPQWLMKEAEAGPDPGTSTRSSGTASLDIETAMKTTQAISSEIELERLLRRIMHIVIENAGAQKGFLILDNDGRWEIAAQGDIDDREENTALPVPIDDIDTLPSAVIYYVAHTRERVVLDDAASQGFFINDPYITKHGIKSLLCAPLLNRGALLGIMYLENNLATHAFTPARVQLLEILLLQAAISLVNARMYEEVQRLNTELEQRVATRTSQLENTMKELEAFSYSVSHDLRAPLRAINGFSQAILEEYLSLLDETGRDYFNRILKASQSMESLIDDLLTLSHITRQEMRREKIDLCEMAQSVINDLHVKEPRRRVQFITTQELPVNGDKNLLRIALTNLLGNAWKFTRRHQSARIEMGAVTLNGEKVYFISDDGAGFNMAYAGQLFRAFKRLHTSVEFEGTGIGLATVQRIISCHGGRIWAEGEVEKGATFYFTLPGALLLRSAEAGSSQTDNVPYFQKNRHRNA